LFLVASFGALAVLVYGVPQAELSQPLICWADMLFLQRLLFRYAFYPHFTLAQWCYHINDPEVHNQGYLFIVFLILSRAILLLVVALFINNLSGHPQRHYPRYWL
jgi:CBS-domain-containing membrane protein